MTNDLLTALRTSVAGTDPDSVDRADPRRDIVKRAIFAEVGHRLGRTCIARITTRVLADIDATLAQGPAVQLPTVDELAARYARLDGSTVGSSHYQAAAEALELVQRAPQPTLRQRASEAITAETPLSPAYAADVIKAIEAAGLRIVDADEKGTADAGPGSEAVRQALEIADRLDAELGSAVRTKGEVALRVLARAYRTAATIPALVDAEGGEQS